MVHKMVHKNVAAQLKLFVRNALKLLDLKGQILGLNESHLRNT